MSRDKNTDTGYEIEDDFDDFSVDEARTNSRRKKNAQTAVRRAADDTVSNEADFDVNNIDFEAEERRISRKEMQMRRRKRERAFRIVAIILILVIAALFALYFFRDKLNIFNTSTGNDVNIYPPGTAATDAVADIPSDELAPEESVPTEAPVAAVSNGVLPPASEASSNNLLDMIMEGGGSHAVYLTFDDGPTENITPQVLDILDQYGVKATFFEVGKNIEAYPEIAQRVADEGHCIAGHSYTHDYDTLYASEESFRDEVDKTYALISSLYPADEPPMKLIRFPGGSYNAGDHAAEKQIYKETLRAMDFYYADWNSLNGDAEGEAKDADGLYNYFVASVSTNNLVVLMHDAATKQETVNALPRIIEYLQQNGYEFRTLDNIVYNPAQ